MQYCLEPAANEGFINLAFLATTAGVYFITMYEAGSNGERNEQQCEWWNTHKADPLAAKGAAHRAAQTLSHQIHGRHHNQRHEEGEDQTVDDGPAEWLPERRVVSTKPNVRIEFFKH